MNNEERILDLLGNLTAQVGTMSKQLDTLTDRMGTVESKVDTLTADMTDVKSDIAELKTRATKIEVTQENVMLPRLQVLMEGHDTLHDQIRRLSVVDRLQDDVTTLKTAVRYLSEKVEKLEQAI